MHISNIDYRGLKARDRKLSSDAELFSIIVAYNKVFKLRLVHITVKYNINLHCASFVLTIWTVRHSPPLIIL